MKNAGIRLIKIDSDSFWKIKEENAPKNEYDD